ncbi:monovalent cation/H(+) antiporter subunit G [Microcella daejeonensis]|uniref:Monovalent cation/H(+) antiporter subunit G n=1 Tax=Microcella daejeonensis TaxID=2994971 RepID=A0A9E8MLH4_9MICO|nr:monovalent cation/H(+) antiporter subunit G [Microcella daejeonensis]WAB81808.1 monovalent cation/H(+) antiporter subunit G [Microcella daejeonensis]
MTPEAPVIEALDIAAGVLLVLGGFLSLAAGIGLNRFPDALSRLHAATKPQILGLVFVVLALALSVRSGAVLLLLVPVVVFQMLTAPIAAHMVGRAGYRTGDFDAGTLIVDELAEDIASAGRGDLPGGELPGGEAQPPPDDPRGASADPRADASPDASADASGRGAGPA